MLTAKKFTIHLPQLEQIEQGKEYFILERQGKREKITFHDYDRIFEIPDLYEYLFHERYKCNSPEVVCGLLRKHLAEAAGTEAPLRALDIGAGNGMVGEQLKDIGADAVVGVDIIEEAAAAARRDRPEVYDAYHVADLTRLAPEVTRALEESEFNCMTVVAALGFGDIPADAFASGYNLLSSPAWVAFNIKEEFVCTEDQTGFCQLIERLEADGLMAVREKRRYRHRYCQDGTPLYYYAIVGEKCGDIPREVLHGISA